MDSKREYIYVFADDANDVIHRLKQVSIDRHRSAWNVNLFYFYLSFYFYIYQHRHIVMHIDRNCTFPQNKIERLLEKSRKIDTSYQCVNTERMCTFSRQAIIFISCFFPSCSLMFVTATKMSILRFINVSEILLNCRTKMIISTKCHSFARANWKLHLAKQYRMYFKQ